MEIDSDSPRVRFPPPFVFIGTLLAALALQRLIGSPDIPFLGNRAHRLLGIAGLVLGLGIIAAAHGLFFRSHTDTRPWKASDALVIEGVYRWTRNPMYLGMALTYAGIAILADSLAALILLLPVIAIIQWQVIAPEEAYLEGRFGDSYRAYKASVRRWI